MSFFIKSPLVSWVKTFQDGYDDDIFDCKKLFDGIFLLKVWERIDPNSSFQSHASVDDNDDSFIARIRNLSTLLYNVKSFYRDTLGQLLVLKLPDLVNISRNVEDESNWEDMQTILLLLLGSAVQCENKEQFIEGIKKMDVSIQHSIVDCIQQITDNPASVWFNNEWGDLTLLPENEQNRMYSFLVQNVNKLAKERDDLSQKVIELVIDNESTGCGKDCHNRTCRGDITLSTANPSINSLTSSEISTANVGTSSMYNSYSSAYSSLANGCNDQRSHVLVELAEAKSKLRKAHQELEEKNESLAELKEVLDQSKETCSKLRLENLELIHEARSAKTYRDEIDVLTEKVRKVDRLESEVLRYRDKMNELEFYKSRVEEMREDARILTETKKMLEEQLETSRKRSEQMPELEVQLMQLRACSNELSLQRDLDKSKIESLMEELTTVKSEKKSIIEELAQVQCELGHLRCQLNTFESLNQNGLESNLLEQLTNDASKRVLKLELENQKLHSLIENFKNSKSNYLISSSMINSDKLYNEPKNNMNQHFDSPENKSTSDSESVSHVSELNYRLEKMERENIELKNTIERLKKEIEAELNILEVKKNTLENDLSNLKQKFDEEIYKREQCEDNLSSLNAENQRLVKQLESCNKRLEDANQEIQALENQNQKLQSASVTLRNTVTKLNKLEKDMTHVEGENHRLEQERKSVEKEINRLKMAIDSKDSIIDEQSNRLSSLELEKKELLKKIEMLSSNINNMKELEKENKETNKELIVSKNKLSTLKQDLINEKIKSQSFGREMRRISHALSELSVDDCPNENEQSNESFTFVDVTEGTTNWLEVFKNKIDKIVNKVSTEKEEKIENLQNYLNEVENKLAKVTEELDSLKQTIKTQDSQENKEIIPFNEKFDENVKYQEEIKYLKNENCKLLEMENLLKNELKRVKLKLECMSEEANALQSKEAEFRVEKRLLLIQTESLSSQNTSLQSQLQSIEECRDSIEAKYRKLQENNQTLISDHQSLQAIHQQLSGDYENLLNSHNSLKNSHKLLKNELKEAKDKLEVWTISHEELKRVVEEPCECKKNKEKLEEITKLEEENKRQLEDYRRIESELKMVQNIYKQLRTENNELKLKHTELEGETADCRNRMCLLQVEVNRLTNYCESLTHAYCSLAEERRCLLSEVSSLLNQYHTLLIECNRAESVQSERIADLATKRERLEKMIRDYDAMSERKKKVVTMPTNLIVSRRLPRSNTDHHINANINEERLKRISCPPINENDLYDRLWESNTAAVMNYCERKSLEDSESNSFVSPPRPPPRNQVTIENKMTINVINNSNLGRPRHNSNFVRSTFRSSSMNFGSSNRRLNKEILDRSSHRIHHHPHVHHHVHHTVPAEAVTANSEESDLSDGGRNSITKTNAEGPSSPKNASGPTWYEYGCV